VPGANVRMMRDWVGSDGPFVVVVETGDGIEVRVVDVNVGVTGRLADRGDRDRTEASKLGAIVVKATVVVDIVDV
jgi:predicted NAD/FAD-dependent oxidoreductase